MDAAREISEEIFGVPRAAALFSSSPSETGNSGNCAAPLRSAKIGLASFRNENDGDTVDAQWPNWPGTAGIHGVGFSAASNATGDPERLARAAGRARKSSSVGKLEFGSAAGGADAGALTGGIVISGTAACEFEAPAWAISGNAVKNSFAMRASTAGSSTRSEIHFSFQPGAG